jgi:hypothetical protein
VEFFFQTFFSTHGAPAGKQKSVIGLSQTKGGVFNIDLQKARQFFTLFHMDRISQSKTLQM